LTTSAFTLAPDTVGAPKVALSPSMTASTWSNTTLSPASLGSFSM